jgi:hypothetical protein
MNTRKPLPITVLSLLLVLFTGCTSLSLKKPDVWPLNISDNKPGLPSQLITNWTDTILYPSNDVPVRGFGGRIMFYADGKKDPIKVNGTLVVYAFDESNRDSANVKPDRKFVFTKEQLATHYSKSKLGHSYSVWLPWDNAGGDQKEISLIARFMPEKGNLVVSEPIRQLLPGKTENVASKPSGFALPNSGSIQPVSYECSTAPAAANGPGKEYNSVAPRNMVTTTFAVPPSSLLKPTMIAGANGGVNYPQATPLAGFNRAMPGSQVPSMPAGAGMNAPQNAAIGPAAYPTMNAGMIQINPANPVNQPNPVNPMISTNPPRNSTYSQPSNRSGLGQPQAPGASFSQPMPYRGQWQPNPTGPGCCPGAPSLSGMNRGFPASPEGAAPPMN